MTWRAAILTVIAMLPVAAAAAPSACPEHFYQGEVPDLANLKLTAQTREVCHAGYAALNSGVTRTPLWSAEHLTAAAVASATTFGRIAAFHAEHDLPRSERAELKDYKGSPYDRGHLAPADDMADATAQRESFSLTNMVPQDPHLNRGLWTEIEEAVRVLATRDGEVYVVTGPIFQGEDLQALNGRVLVPTGLFKAIYDPVRGQAGAYVVPNTARGRSQVISLARLRELAGIDAFPGLDAAVKDRAGRLPAPRPLRWPSTAVATAGSTTVSSAPASATPSPSILGELSRMASAILPTAGDRACCKRCMKGQACGDQCIGAKLTCRKPPGCAC